MPNASRGRPPLANITFGSLSSTADSGLGRFGLVPRCVWAEQVVGTTVQLQPGRRVVIAHDDILTRADRPTPRY
jgi:hypothetical protein